MYTNITDKLQKPVPAVSLAFFRVIFGMLMCVSMLRFIAKGWIFQYYIEPKMFFPYYGFGWVKPLPGPGMYIVFYMLCLLSLCIALGFLYRLSAVLFFILFTYAEVIDKTNYLNHYYLVSLLGLLIVFLPLHSDYSLDAYLHPSLRRRLVPRWTLGSIRLQMGLVYFFAGLAKIKYDWLFEAQPLKIWLAANADVPFIGPLLGQAWVAYFFSWAGMIFDLSVPLLLLSGRTRIFAYLLVVVFHIFTLILFNIGMFPLMMMLFALVFFPSGFHKNILDKLFFFIPRSGYGTEMPKAAGKSSFAAMAVFLVSFFIFQLIFPLRYLLYPGNVFLTEEGFRFSWNVMLMEKNGHTEFYIKDTRTQKRSFVKVSRYLTRQQERMMSSQPDMILQFAHFIAEEYRMQTGHEAEVYAECYVSVNGKASRPLVDPLVNLAREEDGWAHKRWILD